MAQTKFDNIYIRSSLECDGTVPSLGVSSDSPDMFSTGTVSMPNYIQTLSKNDSYKSQLEDKAVLNMDNYCYLRCKNNNDRPVTGAKAQMFYTTSGLVLWPESWTPMPVDISQSPDNTLTDMAAGGIGVVMRPFIWKMPPPVL